MTEEVLVIVDPQFEFTAFSGKVLRGCAKELKKAISKNQSVFYICYDGFGEIAPQLLEISQGKHDIIRKNSMGGGYVLVDFWLKKYKKLPNKIKVCGVDTVACVVSTVCELATSLPHAEICVLRHGCGTTATNLKWTRFFQPFLSYYQNIKTT